MFAAAKAAKATGGVTIDNAGDWIRAGAVAVGGGRHLLGQEGLDRLPQVDVVGDE